MLAMAITDVEILFTVCF